MEQCTGFSKTDSITGPAIKILTKHFPSSIQKPTNPTSSQVFTNVDKNLITGTAHTNSNTPRSFKQILDPQAVLAVVLLTYWKTIKTVDYSNYNRDSKFVGVPHVHAFKAQFLQ